MSDLYDTYNVVLCYAQDPATHVCHRHAGHKSGRFRMCPAMANSTACVALVGNQHIIGYESLIVML